MAFALAATLAIALAATGAALHADEPMQVTVLNPESYPLAGGTQPILDLAASALLPGYAFAQVPDSTPPTFVLSGLDIDTGTLTITFSETIDAASIVPARMHVRESGTYTGGVTLTSRRACHCRRHHHDLVYPHSITPCGSCRTDRTETDHRARGGAGRVR